jgi:hypothetical protein
MKFIYIFFFFLIFSCTTIKKEYVCGDHPCIDKKEFNEYFTNNLIIEIEPYKNNKNKSPNLVSINTDSLQKKNTNTQTKRDKKIEAKKKKENLKAEKIRLLEERKIRKKEEKKTKQKLKITKLKMKKEISNNKKQINIIEDDISITKKTSINKIKKKTSINLLKSEKKKNICDEIKDCDIDKIAELLKKKGKDKPYPNISSN